MKSDCVKNYLRLKYYFAMTYEHLVNKVSFKICIYYFWFELNWDSLTGFLDNIHNNSQGLYRSHEIEREITPTKFCPWFIEWNWFMYRLGFTVFRNVFLFCSWNWTNCSFMKILLNFLAGIIFCIHFLSSLLI